jgi:hypothetical protein
MKRILVLLIVMIVCGKVAQATDVKVEVMMTTEPGGEEMTSFAPDTPKIFAIFKTNGAQNGDKIRGLWIAEDVGNAAKANSKIDEKTLTLKEDTDDGRFSLAKNTDRWPAGKYRLEIYVNGELATTAKFTINGSKEKDSAASEESAESSEPAEGEYSFRVHNTTKDRITKLLASEDGEKYGSFDVGRAGVGPGRTVTLNWDKSTNDSKCEWFIKAVFDDGSETHPKKFDFCEEDLELEF